MDKKINVEQNKNENLDCLASQKYLYSSAKSLMGIQIFFNVILIVIASFIVYIFNSGWFFIKYDLSAYLALISIIATISNSLFFIPVIRRKKELAAKIQERFDTKVLSLNWNTINIGNVPDSEDIKTYSEKYKKENNGYDGLSNWYSSTLDSIPLNVGRYICQRSNLSWDMFLRAKYINYITIFSILFSVIVLFLGFLSDPNLKGFVLNIAMPLLPIVIFCIEQYRDNKESIENLKNLKQDLNSCWQELISNQNNESIEITSRRIQDEIYKNRKDNQLIFDWIYNKYRDENEEAMYYSVEDMINEYNNIKTV